MATEVGSIYPGTGERIVGKIPNPSGPGFYLQGEYGGIFAEGGAPYLGGYFDPNMAEHRNDPNRRFTGIEALEGGGYRSISATAGEAGYSFRPQATSAPAAATTPPPTAAETRATSPEGISAKATLASTLRTYGLPESLVATLWDDWYVDKAKPFTQIMMDLEGTTEFKTRFPGLTTLRERQNGGEAVTLPSVGEYIQLEVGIASVLRDAGLPPGMWDDPTDYAKFIGGSTSPKEVEDRIAYARTVAFNAPVEVREELNRVYGIEPGDLVAFVLDPERAMPAIQKKVQAASVGGAARKVGFGLLTQAEMEQLAGSDTTEAEAEQGFGTLAEMGEGLFEETVEESLAGEDLGRSTQIGFVGGSGEARGQMTTRRQRRAAQFQGGGGAASGGGGKTGLG